MLKRILLYGLLALVLTTVLPVILFRWVPIPTTSFILHQQISNAFDDRQHPPLLHRWQPAERISRWAQLAVIAAEDQKFLEHDGFDVEAIQKAIQHNERNRRKRGASTISQQVAKNLFLWPSRSWVRKGFEVYFTLLIETLWTKERILEVYLNCAEFGDNTYGVEAAAQRFWKKPAAKLTSYEAATLAAVLPNPRRFKAQAPSTYVQTRAAWIHNQMNHLGLGYLKAR